jgi:hypothetical protein
VDELQRSGVTTVRTGLTTGRVYTRFFTENGDDVDLDVDGAVLPGLLIASGYVDMVRRCVDWAIKDLASLAIPAP